MQGENVNNDLVNGEIIENNNENLNNLQEQEFNEFEFDNDNNFVCFTCHV
jgi:hypothetical protein